jgi:hypothetical protein
MGHNKDNKMLIQVLGSNILSFEYRRVMDETSPSVLAWEALFLGYP